MRTAILDRLRKAEARLAQRTHCGVVLFHEGAEIPALLQAASDAGRIHPAHGVLVLPHDVSDAAEWERGAVAGARARRAQYPTAPRTFAAPAPIAPEGAECKPGSGAARAVIVETRSNVRINVRYFTTHAAATAACDAMNATTSDSRFEVAHLAAPTRRR